MSESEDHKIIPLRELIEQFIQERLKPKIEEQQKKLEKAVTQEEKDVIEDKIRSLIIEYSRETWLKDAAKRSQQIKLATHIPKFTHPMAKASPVYFKSDKTEPNNIINSSCIKESYKDVTGNAAALDVFAFLNQMHDGEKILDMVSRKSQALASAMSDDVDEAYDWIDIFSTISELKSPASHTLMKQVYFPLDNGEYHLISPVFPTSLVHEVHETIRADRFSDEVSAARKAKRDNKHSDVGLRDFPELAFTYYGGTKPQNVSQLNSNRGGAGVLLASLPPNWRSKSVRPALNVSTFSYRFADRYFVKELFEELIKLLKTDHDDFHIRGGVKNLVEAMAYELAVMADEMLELPAGWSKAPKCRLNQYEKLWLDPFSDEEGSRDAYISGEWCSEVAGHFSRWLKNKIKQADKDIVVFGEDEWRKIAAYILDDVRRGNLDEQ